MKSELNEMNVDTASTSSKRAGLQKDTMEKSAGKTSKKEREKRRCNLCGREFKARNRFMRFCDVCKGRSEVYRFAGTYAF